MVGSIILAPSLALPIIGLMCGGVFFLYGLKYYASIALILLASSVSGGGNGNGNGRGYARRLDALLNGGNGNGNGHVLRQPNGNGHGKQVAGSSS